MNTLGNKIRVFRKLKGFSQLELELAVGLSTGTISRIENNDINPPKETILKISKVLKLNGLELEYLIGYLAEPASKEEIEDIRQSLKSELDNPFFFGYILDDRHRFIDISKGFRIATKMSEEEYKYTFLKSTPEIFLTEKIPFIRSIDPKYVDEIVGYRFLEVYQDMYFMQGDKPYDEMIHFINSNPKTLEYWNKASEMYKSLIYRTYSAKELKLNLYGTQFDITYTVERLNYSNRFRLVEFKPTNKFLKYFHKIIR